MLSCCWSSDCLRPSLVCKGLCSRVLCVIEWVVKQTLTLESYDLRSTFPSLLFIPTTHTLAFISLLCHISSPSHSPFSFRPPSPLPSSPLPPPLFLLPCVLSSPLPQPGGIVLPLLGAVPDSAMIIASGIGGTRKDAQQEINVGMGWAALSSPVLSYFVLCCATV